MQIGEYFVRPGHPPQVRFIAEVGINGKSTATGSGQINIHLNNMLTLPVALTYTSHATSTVKKGLQLTFGVTSLFDAFLSNLPH